MSLPLENKLALVTGSSRGIGAAIAKRLAKDGASVLVHYSASLGEAVPVPGVGVYAGTKFAVQGFTRGWSRELGPLDITVNNVQPGPIDTELIPADGPRADVLKRLTSVGRYGKVEEIASAVSFLANPEQAFINGESLTVDGGWNA